MVAGQSGFGIGSTGKPGYLDYHVLFTGFLLA